MPSTADRPGRNGKGSAVALVFDRDRWEEVKRTRADVAVGEMERLEPHATQLSRLLIFDLEEWESIKFGGEVAVGDMERLEAIGELR